MLNDGINGKIDLVVSDRAVTYGDLKGKLDRALGEKIRAVCIPPCFVRWAKKYVGDRLKVCMLVDVPGGNETINAKVCQIREGLKNGADEFEVAVNINEIKSGNVDYMFGELRQLKRASRSRLFKCAIDPRLLSGAETETFCKYALYAKCDYISLGMPFGGYSALEEVEKIKGLVGKKIKVKAFSPEPSEKFVSEILDGGADRVGVISFPKASAEVEEKSGAGEMPLVVTR